MGLTEEMMDTFGVRMVRSKKKIRIKKRIIKKKKAIPKKTHKRRRGTAIIDTEKGILLTAIKHQYLLPGGGPKKGESRLQAAIRETKEETGLEPYYAKILFKHESHSNKHTVVLIKANRKARPKAEVSKIKYYTPGKNYKMSSATKAIIKKYLELKEKQ